MEPELIKGRDGVFEVKLDNELIYSKRSTGRFPSDGEIEELLQGRIGS